LMNQGREGNVPDNESKDNTGNLLLWGAKYLSPDALYNS
jgi:hypothetical protein